MNQSGEPPPLGVAVGQLRGGVGQRGARALGQQPHAQEPLHHLQVQRHRAHAHLLLLDLAQRCDTTTGKVSRKNKRKKEIKNNIIRQATWPIDVETDILSFKVYPIVLLILLKVKI